MLHKVGIFLLALLCVIEVSAQGRSFFYPRDPKVDYSQQCRDSNLYVGAKAKVAYYDSGYDFDIKITGIDWKAGFATGELGCTTKGWCGHSKTGTLYEAPCSLFYQK